LQPKEKRPMKLIISIVLRTIPRIYLHQISATALQIIGIFYLGNNFEDPISGKKYRKFLPYGRVHSRANALSPGSMSLERHRLIWLYLKNKTDFFTTKKKMLHIAPEYCFIKKFKAMPNLEYITGDIESPWADVKMDIHQIPFDNNTFDVVMCNHVLEHVESDEIACKEILRVMKPGAFAILQSPIDYNRNETYEDSSITDPKEREKHFLQDDHLRIFGLDYGKRLAGFGFEVSEEDYIHELKPELVIRYGLPVNEKIYLCKKPLKA